MELVGERKWGLVKRKVIQRSLWRGAQACILEPSSGKCEDER